MASSTTRRNRKKQKYDRNPNPAVAVLIVIVAYLLVFGIMSAILVAPKSNIEEGEIANETIISNRDVVDTHTTNILKQEARNDIGAIYRRDERITSDAKEELEECLISLDEVRQKGKEEYTRMKSAGEDIKYTVDFYEECIKLLPDGYITGDIMGILQINDEEEYIRIKETINNYISKEMESGITENELEDRKTSLKNQLIFDAFDDDVRKLGSKVLDLYLVANTIFDADATEVAKDQAENQVEPVTYKEGEIIIREGMPVKKAQLEVLKELGLVEDDATGWVEYLSVALLVLIFFIIGIVYILNYHRKVAYHNKNIALIVTSILITMALSWVCTIFSIFKYLLPISYAPLMIVLVMIDKKVAIFINSILALLIGLMYMKFGDGSVLPIVIAGFAGGTASVYSVQKASQRSSLLVSGVISGMVMGIVYVIFDLINNVVWTTTLLHWGYGLVSGLAVAVLAIGTLPLWETIFSLVTSMKLMELTNPNQPLLKKLLIEAPGTYHHSIMVGNMAERAADSIGANSLVVRAGCYYHDIGKTKRPYFFIENHNGNKNPHDNINSSMSVNVITSHVSYGIDMVKKAKLPEVVQDIVAQHHGDTAVMYFYLKDKEQSKYPDNIKIDNYRYPGERPKSKEAAIVMLADSCEAAVRSIDEPTREKVQEKIDSVVKGKLDDGQLDYCDLTLKEISIIKNEFLTALNGLFHERIEYPDKRDDDEDTSTIQKQE